MSTKMQHFVVSRVGQMAVLQRVVPPGNSSTVPVRLKENTGICDDFWPFTVKKAIFTVFSKYSKRGLVADFKNRLLYAMFFVA